MNGGERSGPSSSWLICKCKVTDKGVRVAAVCGPLTALSANKLKEADPAYTGAHLILNNIPKVQ